MQLYGKKNTGKCWLPFTQCPISSNMFQNYCVRQRFGIITLNKTRNNNNRLLHVLFYLGAKCDLPEWRTVATKDWEGR